MLVEHPNLKPISEVLQVAAISDSEQEKTIAIKACLKLLNELKETGPVSSQLYYLLGYAWYLSADSKERGKNIIAYFSRALELDFENQSAKIYLCHYFFDSGSFSEFLKHYQQIERNQMIKWRRLKFSEMNIIAKADLNILDESDINWYIQDYENAVENDQPMITELFQYSRVSEYNFPEGLQSFIDKWSNFWGLIH